MKFSKNLSESKCNYIEKYTHSGVFFLKMEPILAKIWIYFGLETKTYNVLVFNL